MLEITNFGLIGKQPLNCSVITSKLYTEKYREVNSAENNYLVKSQKSDYLLYDDKIGSIYVRASSMHIDDLRSFNSYLGRDLIYRKILEDGELRIYPTLRISSITGKELLITLKEKNVYYELICGSEVIIKEDRTLEAKYYLFNKQLFNNEINKLTSQNLKLEKYWWINYNEGTVVVPIEFLYSIETLGETNLQLTQPSCEHYYNCVLWTPNEIEFTEIRLNINISNKFIYGCYYKSVLVKAYSGRRSYGWVDKYSTQEASFYKKFDLLYNLKEYFKELPILLERINGVVQINSSENVFLPNEFIIKFNEKVTFSEINKLLDFTVEGYEYIEYQETD